MKRCGLDAAEIHEHYDVEGCLSFKGKAMSIDDVIDLGREAIFMMLMTSAPILLVAFAVGLLVGLLQAMTQIQEATLAFVPKIVAVVLAVSLMLPWLVSQMVQFSRELIIGIPGNL